MSTSPSISSDDHREPNIGFREFVTMIAAMMAINALAIDVMLPALADIANSIHIQTENGRQWIVTAYILAFGAAQVIYGPIADRFGRRRVILVGLAIYFVFSIIAALATSVEVFLAARVMQGVGSAASRVLAVSIVRDRFSGREMARVMSLAFMVFLAVPIIAPSIGQIIMLFAPWEWIFGILAVYSASLIVWVYLRLPETIHPEDRKPLSATNVIHAFKIVLTNRVTLGYMLAMGLVMGGLFGFINSAEQIFVDVFQAPRLFTTIFAVIAAAIGVASLLNARFVGRLGMRKVSHSALCGYIVFGGLHAVVAMSGHETIWTFAALQAAVTFCFGLMSSNFGAMAMEPMSHIAGTAASVQGILTTLGGGIAGFVIGQQFDGTTVPFTIGFFVLGLASLVMVLIAEKGRLFHAQHAGDSKGSH